MDWKTFFAQHVPEMVGKEETVKEELGGDFEDFLLDGDKECLLALVDKDGIKRMWTNKIWRAIEQHRASGQQTPKAPVDAVTNAPAAPVAAEPQASPHGGQTTVSVSGLQALSRNLSTTPEDEVHVPSAENANHLATEHADLHSNLPLGTVSYQTPAQSTSPVGFTTDSQGFPGLQKRQQVARQSPSQSPLTAAAVSEHTLATSPQVAPANTGKLQLSRKECDNTVMISWARPDLDYECQIDSWKAGQVIGSQGSKTKEITKESGAKIWVDVTDEETGKTTLWITGRFEEREKARQMIKEVVEREVPSTHFRVTAPSDSKSKGVSYATNKTKEGILWNDIAHFGTTVQGTVDGDFLKLSAWYLPKMISSKRVLEQVSNTKGKVAWKVVDPKRPEKDKFLTYEYEDGTSTRFPARFGDEFVGEDEGNRVKLVDTWYLPMKSKETIVLKKIDNAGRCYFPDDKDDDTTHLSFLSQEQFQAELIASFKGELLLHSDFNKIIKYEPNKNVPYALALFDSGQAAYQLKASQVHKIHGCKVKTGSARQFAEEGAFSAINSSDNGSAAGTAKTPSSVGSIQGTPQHILLLKGIAVDVCNQYSKQETFKQSVRTFVGGILKDLPDSVPETHIKVKPSFTQPKKAPAQSCFIIFEYEVEERRIYENRAYTRDEFVQKFDRQGGTYYLPKHLQGKLVLKLVDGSKDLYRADNSQLQMESSGLQYRRSMKEGDKDPNEKYLPWNETINGEDKGEWIKVTLEAVDAEAKYAFHRLPTATATLEKDLKASMPNSGNHITKLSIERWFMDKVKEKCAQTMGWKVQGNKALVKIQGQKGTLEDEQFELRYWTNYAAPK